MSREKRFVPGPWYESRIDNGLGENGGIAIDSVHPTVGGIFEVCEVWGVDKDTSHDSRSKANARLIAAAPEILEALEESMWQLGVLMGETGVGNEAMWASLEKSKAAIDAAYGEHQ